MKKLYVHESVEQTRLFFWAEMEASVYPELRLMYHIPNGGSRNVLEAANLKRQGVKPGVPDICLPAARGGYHGLYIEMKAICGRPTELQKEWLSALAGQGYYSAVCHGATEAEELILKYLKGEIKC